MAIFVTIVAASSTEYTRDFRAFGLAYIRAASLNVRNGRKKRQILPGGVYASSSFDAGDMAGGDNSCYKKLKHCSSR